jgi:hypothetical protein
MPTSGMNFESCCNLKENAILYQSFKRKEEKFVHFINYYKVLLINWLTYNDYIIYQQLR